MHSTLNMIYTNLCTNTYTLDVSQKFKYKKNWEKKKKKEYIPTNVRLIREFRVAELKKSTRHLYTPPSVSLTFAICRRAFLLLLSSVLKTKRSPKSFAIVECVADFPSRESTL